MARVHTASAAYLGYTSVDACWDPQQTEKELVPKALSLPTKTMAAAMAVAAPAPAVPAANAPAALHAAEAEAGRTAVLSSSAPRWRLYDGDCPDGQRNCTGSDANPLQAVANSGVAVVVPTILHIPKTGVDSLCEELKAQGTWANPGQVHCKGGTGDEAGLVRESCLGAMLAGEFRLTYVRSPREHVISQYSQCRFGDINWHSEVPGYDGSDGDAFSEAYFRKWLEHTAEHTDDYGCYHPANMQGRYLTCSRPKNEAHHLHSEAEREPDLSAALGALARLDFVGVVDLYDESWCALQHALRGELPADCTCDKMGVPARTTRTHVMLWHSHEVHETHSVKPHPSSDELSDATRRLIDSATAIDRQVYTNATARFVGELCALQRASGTQLLCDGQMEKLRNATRYITSFWPAVKRAAQSCKLPP